MTKEIWTGRVEVLTPPTESGNTKAFTNVVTWASNSQSYKDTVESVFEKYGWILIGVEEYGPLTANETPGGFVADAAERAKDNPLACIYSTFHYYPSKPA
jgi:hypothetical protein